MVPIDRRAFLRVSAMAAAAAAVAGRARAAWPAMKLSLSGRISEPIGQVANLVPLTFDEFLQIAKSTGYDAVCLRPRQVSLSTPMEVMVEMARKIRETGLKVSMVTCDTDQPANNNCSPFALLNFTPRIQMAEIFGTKLIRCQIKTPEQLGWAQRAADEARERGISIVHQSHMGTLFSNVDDAVDSLRKINRSNFGLTYEPVNWMPTPKGYGPDAIKAIAPWLFNVYSQNEKAPSGAPAAAAGRGGANPVAAGAPAGGGGRGGGAVASVESCTIAAARGGASADAAGRGGGGTPGPAAGAPAGGAGRGGGAGAAGAPAGGGAAVNDLGLWEPGGVDFDAVFRGLHEVGYTGYFTVHSRTSQVNAPRDLAIKSFAFLKPYADGVKG